MEGPIGWLGRVQVILSWSDFPDYNPFAFNKDVQSPFPVQVLGAGGTQMMRFQQHFQGALGPEGYLGCRVIGSAGKQLR